MCMKIINQDLKKKQIKLKIENLDDLWYLSHIIDKNDYIKGKTVRKIKIGDQQQRNVKIVKKTVFLKLQVEKIEINNDFLRVGGKIVESPEDIPHGSYHTFNLDIGNDFTIIKEKWLKFQLDKIKEASDEKIAKILIVVLDREDSLFALMQRKGYKLLSRMKGEVNKKAVEEKSKSGFYLEIIKQLIEYDKRYEFSKIIIASPIFWKEELMKELKDVSLKQKIIQASCSSVDKNAINEVLKRPETQEALKQDRISKELNLVEDLLKEVSKNALCVYGLKQTENAVNLGAVEVLIMTDSFIKKQREKENYDLIDGMLKNTESMKGKIHIISSEHEGGKKLNGLGGVGGLLRYKLNN
jgi:protein pelota